MPKFGHDCDKCEFLGTHHALTGEFFGQDVDLYLCGSGSHLQIVCRFGHFVEASRTFQISYIQYLFDYGRRENEVATRGLELAEEQGLIAGAAQRRAEMDKKLLEFLRTVLDNISNASDIEIDKAIEILETRPVDEQFQEFYKAYGNPVLQLALLKEHRSHLR
jgi:hypothetical protein